jgi:hypothetical protein
MSPTIIAALIGDDAAQAGDVICRGRSPVFGLCRALLAAGADPASRLECYRGETLCLVIKAIGIGATLTVEESAAGRGPRFTRWKPFSRADVEPPVRRNIRPVAELPEQEALL